jgi:hypothetical protein
MGDVQRRRSVTTIAGLAVLASGLAITLVDLRVPRLGDALYAVLVYLVIAALWPRLRRSAVVVGAAAFCAGIELFQLTDIPAHIGQAVPLARFVLGTSFDPIDLVAYAIGIALVAGLDIVTSRLRASTGRPPGRQEER